LWRIIRYFQVCLNVSRYTTVYLMVCEYECECNLTYFRYSKLSQVIFWVCIWYSNPIWDYLHIWKFTITPTMTNLYFWEFYWTFQMRWISQMHNFISLLVQITMINMWERWIIIILWMIIAITEHILTFGYTQGKANTFRHTSDISLLNPTFYY
jgi:hypothetical protein